MDRRFRTITRRATFNPSLRPQNHLLSNNEQFAFLPAVPSNRIGTRVPDQVLLMRERIQESSQNRPYQ